jgi:hypothetical protein
MFLQDWPAKVEYKQILKKKTYYINFASMMEYEMSGIMLEEFK